jgi:hypothetical protein
LIQCSIHSETIRASRNSHQPQSNSTRRVESRYAPGDPKVPGVPSLRRASRANLS